ncbi:IclR family transcriptional regulator [Priestia aryabhattai]|uniref:IclR family transcriptional regulator n=1 Tax=Priestia megaterium TaxID=1404 RepID=UPI0039B8FDFC
MDTIKSTTMIQSLQVGMSIIDLISSQEQPLKFSEIQELTQITKSNLYKYLNTLTHLELLYRDKKSGTYMLGSKVIEYGMAAIGHQDIISTVTPYLQELSHHTSLTALLAVWTPEGPVVANIWSSNNGLNIGAQIGTRLPILSSTGKIFSSFSPPFLIREWKEKELSGLTTEERALLVKEEENTVKNRITFANEPLVSYVSSVSVPLVNYNGDLLGAITLVGFSQITPHTLEHKASQQLLEISKEISSIFGYKE